jgi:hypothetical protein
MTAERTSTDYLVDILDAIIKTERRSSLSKA